MKGFLSILFLSLVFIGVSQTKVIGEEFKLNKPRTYFEGLVGKRNNELVGVSIQYNKTNVNQVNIEYFDEEKLNHKGTTQIKFPKSKDYDLNPEQIVLIKNKLYAICSKNYRKQSCKVIGAIQILEKGKLGQFIVFDSLHNVGENDEDLYRLIQDKSETKLIYFSKKLDVKTSEQYIELREFNQNLELISEITKSLPNVTKQLDFFNLGYDGLHRFYFLARNHITKHKEITERTIKNNVHHLWCFNSKTDQLKQIELKLKNKWIFDLRLSLIDSNCVIGGIYSNEAANKISGSIHVSISKNFKIKSHSVIAFKKSTIAQLNEKDEGQTFIPNILLHSVLTTKTGKTIIISEQFSKEIEQYYDPQTEAVSYTDVFHFDHVTITWVDENSNVITEYPLLKNQLSTNDGGIYSSFTTMVLGEQLSIFYNDNPKNIKRQDRPKLARTSSAFVHPVETICMEDGIISTHKINEDVQINLIPKNCYQTMSDAPLFLIHEQNRRNQLIRISK